jgi:hypothetical protein
LVFSTGVVLCDRKHKETMRCALRWQLGQTGASLIALVKPGY